MLIGGALREGGNQVWMLSCILLIMGVKELQQNGKNPRLWVRRLISGSCSVTNQLGDDLVHITGLDVSLHLTHTFCFLQWPQSIRFGRAK